MPVKCLDCGGEMKYKETWGDVRWYQCCNCKIIEGSDGSIIRNEMKVGK